MLMIPPIWVLSNHSSILQKNGQKKKQIKRKARKISIHNSRRNGSEIQHQLQHRSIFAVSLASHLRRCWYHERFFSFISLCASFSRKRISWKKPSKLQWVFNRWVRKVKIQNCLRVSGPSSPWLMSPNSLIMSQVMRTRTFEKKCKLFVQIWKLENGIIEKQYRKKRWKKREKK